MRTFFSAKLYNDMENFLFMRLNDGISDFSFSEKVHSRVKKKKKSFFYRYVVNTVTNYALIYQEELQQNFSSNSSKK